MPVIRVRSLSEGDREAVMSLATRLTTGVAPWRDETAVACTVRLWVTESLDNYDQFRRPVFVAEVDGGVVGFVCGRERRHWTGETDAYVGELAVADEVAGQGIGRRLMAMIEEWTRDAGYRRLTLETGAANRGARAFYAALGYQDEGVVLTRALD